MGGLLSSNREPPRKQFHPTGRSSDCLAQCLYSVPWTVSLTYITPRCEGVTAVAGTLHVHSLTADHRDTSDNAYTLRGAFRDASGPIAWVTGTVRFDATSVALSASLSPSGPHPLGSAMFSSSHHRRASRWRRHHEVLFLTASGPADGNPLRLLGSATDAATRSGGAAVTMYSPHRHESVSR